MSSENIENIDEVLKDYLDGDIVEQTTTNLTEPGENYCSVILKVDLKLKNESGEKEEHLVAKTTSPDSEFLLTLFGKELDFYGPAYQEIEKFAKKEGCEDDLKIFPRYLGGRKSLEDPHNLGAGAVLVLENLKVQGYDTVDRKTGFNLEQSKAVLEALSTFHSLGIAMRSKERKNFDGNVLPNIPNLAPPPPDNPDDPSHLKVFRTSVKYLREAGKDPEVLQRMEKLLEGQSVWGTRRSREPWVSFSHNDFWVNNMMLKRDENGKISVKIVDFQAISCNSPAADLIFFLLTSLHENIIRNSFNNLIKYYYDCLINNLKRLHVPNLEQFSYKGLFDEIKEEVIAGELGHALIFFVIVLQNKENVEVPTSDNSHIGLMFGRDFSKEHKSRLLSTFDALVNNGWM